MTDRDRPTDLSAGQTPDEERAAHLPDASRRHFLRRGSMAAGAASAATMLPPAIERALAIDADAKTRSIADVKHIVILMQENRSFDHYFGAMAGVRGFGDRHPVPLESGQDVFHESDGKRIITPYRLDRSTMNAALIPSTPHNFPDAQMAWNQGKFGFWPVSKTEFAMGYYLREEAPFQWALAEFFTICDNYFCSIQTGTDPNRIVFWSGTNFNPEYLARGENTKDDQSEPVNLRCWITGALPTPGYTYAGSSFRWATIPDVLEEAGVDWKVYQDPNDNWTGAMHGCLAFESFRTAQPGSPIYEKGMRHWTIEHLRNDVMNGTLPPVSWILPSRIQSEHPGAPSSPAQGGFFTQQVLEALTSNPTTWSRTVFFITFDENDGLFDHVPPPAVPSYNNDGTLAGKSTLDLKGMYFDNDKGEKYLRKDDTISGNVRPWGLGPRVPMYVISPWSKGGWVSSEVFDHTSVGQFIEQRFGVEIPGITPWHRAVCGDLSSAFDFSRPNDRRVPPLPDMSNYAQVEAASKLLPKASAPATPAPLYQETGLRLSRATPYALEVEGRVRSDGHLRLNFRNEGEKGAVFHVYDRLHLDRIPRRYTVEAGSSLSDDWWTGDVATTGQYDLWVCGPNGFVRSFKGRVPAGAGANPEVRLDADRRHRRLSVEVQNRGAQATQLRVVVNAYEKMVHAVRRHGPWGNDSGTFELDGGLSREVSWHLEGSGGWYDFTLVGEHFERRFAGRIENGEDSFSDPEMAMHLGRRKE